MMLEMRLLRYLRVGVRKKTGSAKPPAMFSVSISVIRKEYITHQYTSMHQADYNLAAYMDTGSIKVNNWSQKKRLLSGILKGLEGSGRRSLLLESSEEYRRG